MPNNPLARYFVAAVLARLADGGARVALVLLALDRTSNVAFGGWLVAALMFPHVLAAPAVGGWADRTRHVKTLHAAGPIVYGIALAACALTTGLAPNAVPLAFAALAGCAARTDRNKSSCSDSSRQAFHWPSRPRSGLLGLPSC